MATDSAVPPGTVHAALQRARGGRGHAISDIKKVVERLRVQRAKGDDLQRAKVDDQSRESQPGPTHGKSTVGHQQPTVGSSFSLKTKERRLNWPRTTYERFTVRTPQKKSFGKTIYNSSDRLSRPCRRRTQVKS